MLEYIPNKVLWILEFYGTIPWTPVWIGQAFNIIIFITIIIFLYINDKKTKTYWKGIIKKHNVQLLDWKTGAWKTRLLTQISKDRREQNKNLIIISNFLNWYWDFGFLSMNDFKLLQIDIARLWEQNNFDLEQKKIIERQFPGYFLPNKEDEDEVKLLKKIKKIKWKYDFLTLCDEFYWYFHNRNFQSNFSKKTNWDHLLLNLHQTRHNNQTILMRSQDGDNLDLDFRQIAHNEINVFSFFSDLFYWYFAYKYLSKKQIAKTWIEFKKIGFFPHMFLNWYELSYKINNIKLLFYNVYNILFVNDIKLKEFKNSKINYIFEKINNFRFIKIKKLLFNKKDYFKKKQLKFYTKFNVKTSLDIYYKGKLYDYILNLEKKLDL